MQASECVNGASQQVTEWEPIAEECPVEILRAEINSLPVQQRLFHSPQYDVYVARRSEVPNVLQEIGRLRELSFREVGEGTGRATDLEVGS